MDILEIEQNVGIGQIKLGMEREEVYKVLDKRGEDNATIEWIRNYHIEYRNDKVVFIEIPNSVSDDYFVLYQGVDVFKTEAKLLVRHITEYGKYEETDQELGYTYSFPSLGIGLWRPSIFEYEMLLHKEFRDMPEEIQLDQMKYLYFESACAFTPDYYPK